VIGKALDALRVSSAVAASRWPARLNQTAHTLSTGALEVKLVVRDHGARPAAKLARCAPPFALGAVNASGRGDRWMPPARTLRKPVI